MTAPAARPRTREERQALAEACENIASVCRTLAFAEVNAVNLEAAAAELRRMDWQPIATVPLDGSVVLRPHRIWGAMDVRYKPMTGADGKAYNWLNGDYTTAWPDDALLPFWQPLPSPPEVTP